MNEDVLGVRIFPSLATGLLHWLTYVPDFAKAPEGILALLRSAKRMSPERQTFQKALKMEDVSKKDADRRKKVTEKVRKLKAELK